MGGNIDETSRGQGRRTSRAPRWRHSLDHKNVFTRERSTYALVRTLTLGVRMQPYTAPKALATGRQSRTRLNERTESRQLSIGKKGQKRVSLRRLIVYGFVLQDVTTLQVHLAPGGQSDQEG